MNEFLEKPETFHSFCREIEKFRKEFGTELIHLKKSTEKEFVMSLIFYSLFLFLFAIDFVADSWEMHIEGAWLQTSSAMIFAKNPMIDCLQWKGVNQQSFQKCTFENEMIMAVSDKRTLIGQVCYWNHFLRQWSEIPLE